MGAQSSRALIISKDEWRGQKEYSENPDHAQECEVTMINTTDQTLYLCWVDEEGDLHNFEPIHSPHTIKDGSVKNSCTQSSRTHHVFVFYVLDKGQEHYKHVKHITPKSFLCLYRPLLGEYKHVLSASGSEGNVKVKIALKHLMDFGVELVDNSHVEYVEVMVHGFRVFYESTILETEVVSKDLLDAIRSDIRELCVILPQNALEQLQSNTPFYINYRRKYGPKHKPEKAQMCYHPKGAKSWLKHQGLPVDHECSIEMFDAEDYLRDRHFWGPGGLFIHELCHAYHDQCMSDGYNNKMIQEAYHKAMSSCLYDNVTVKKAGPGRPKAGPMKGYCAANCQEFFAELSTAWMCEDPQIEFNKWEPFNRAQLKARDPDTCEIIEKAWTSSLDDAS